jgi:crossover junction endodeoxyribonuclease RuvC
MLVGIDPGLCGAVAVVHADNAVEVHDTPTLTVRTSRGVRQVYDVPGMVALLTPYDGAPLHVVIEEAQAMPGQGVRSTFSTGVGWGVWLGILGALALPYTSVRPTVWKRAMGLAGKDKEQARARAIQLFPGADLRRKKDHGRAEALLLAWWGFHQGRAQNGAFEEPKEI